MKLILYSVASCSVFARSVASSPRMVAGASGLHVRLVLLSCGARRRSRATPTAVAESRETMLYKQQ
eukprot:COSAG02_NODE_3039_length_7496_cov_89.964715_5_plen_66_part_00